MSELCTVRYLPPEEIESMLAKQYGMALRPINENAKRPSVMDLSRMAGSPATEQKKKPTKERFCLKLQPKDLTAHRVRELVKEGKSSDEVMVMYNFKNRGYFTQSLRELGCHDLVGGQGKKKVW